MTASSSAPGKSAAASPSPIPTRAGMPMRIWRSGKPRARCASWWGEASSPLPDASLNRPISKRRRMAIGLAANADAMGAFSPGGGMSGVRRDRAEPALRGVASERKITPCVAPPRHPWQRAGQFATERKAPGGFIVNGRWPFSSAVDNSEWNMLAVTVHDDDGQAPVDWPLRLVPKSDYEIIDPWYAMGMAATGSKDVAVSELFVPERRALPLLRCRGGHEHPGAALNAGALFCIPLVAASSHPLAPAAVGAAEGAHELFLAAMAKRAGTYTGARVADFQAVPDKGARARAPIDSARDLLRQSAIAFQAAAERHEVPDLETKLRFRAHSAFAVNQAREAVETLWSCYGAQGLYTRDPLQRHLRDVLAINQHFSFNFDIAGAAYGLLA